MRTAARPLRVLLVHKNDRGVGGGNVAMNRLRDGLRSAGVEATILCHRTDGDPDSVVIPRPAAVRTLEATARRLLRPMGLNDLHGLGAFGVRHMEVFRQADVVDIHGLHGGYFNFLALPAMSRDRPTVLTLHDMWSFTGHCGFSLDCERWRSGCGRCPHPDAPPAVRRDATRIEWWLKKRAWSGSRLTLVAPSRWMAETVRQSILGRFPVVTIPDGVDLRGFRPRDRDASRADLGIPRDAPVLFFCAADLDDPRKGPDLLTAAIGRLPAPVRRDLVLLLMGRNGRGLAARAGVKVIDLGFVDSVERRCVAFSAADVFVLPSRNESFGLVLVESMACGRPAVAFGVGGCVDLVRHGTTGFLARPGDVDDLARRLEQLLGDARLRDELGARARRIAEREHSIQLRVQRHIRLYRRLAAGRRPDRASMPMMPPDPHLRPTREHLAS